MKLSTALTLPLAAGVLGVPSCNSPKPLANETNTYDYIVVGSGPGGGTLSTNLALAGYKVLLIEAGDDQSGAISTEITNLYSMGTPTSWAFYVRHSDDMEQTLRYNLLVWKLKDESLWVGREPPEADAEMLGVYYPRGATLGGSAIVNAAVAHLPSDSDWDIFSEGSKDKVWSGREMRRIFEKIEHNNYLKPGTPEARGHGFRGWLQTNIGGKSVYERTLRLPVVQAGLKLIGKDPEKVRDYITSDGNYDDPKRGFKEGLFGLPFHVSKSWRRFSPRDRILAITAATTANGKKKYKLDLQLNSLATKVLFEDDCSGKSQKKSPKAVGVEWLEGAAVYKGDPRWNSTIKAKVGRAFARKEVIVAGGTFSTPQLLQLSGIGPRKLLERYNIPVVVDSPGVGRNLQDNYEIPIVGYAQQSLVMPPDPNAPACTYGAPGDPCIELWRNNAGPYTQGGENGFNFMLKTKHSPDGEVDMLLFLVPAPLRGFTPPNANWTTDPSLNTVFSWSMVKIHPQNKAGYIEIRSSDPTDTPDINLNYFGDGGSETDINAILDVVAWVRRSYTLTAAPVGPVTSVEPPCSPADINADGYCKDPEVDKRWIVDQIFGHHPTSTARVGPDNDPLAVLDTRLRVRGVKNLRVVDASAFPRTPGAFPAISTMMLGEKASRLILEGAKRI